MKGGDEDVLWNGKSHDMQGSGSTNALICEVREHMMSKGGREEEKSMRGFFCVCRSIQ